MSGLDDRAHLLPVTDCSNVQNSSSVIPHIVDNLFFITLYLVESQLFEERFINYRNNVNMNATLSNDEEEIVSINSEEFAELDDDKDENAYDNRLRDICHLAQPPHETVDGSTWIFCRCDAMFHLFCAYDPSPLVRRIHCPMCGAITES
ncbi:unnamed protein product [Schistosoma curassoni]|uniref:PHD domain-containing protein n=1 Tax=Schistosoma curassoni TaxID=6186 RepID=A0A183JNT3_9TREM|nr:unnamed protein product [Schistosoma curassoni]